MSRAEVFPFAGIGERWKERYPDWIRGLKQKNGVYIIRDRDSGQIVYVGESHSDRLYATLTRHFQAWADTFDTAGPTYHRADVEVAIIVVHKTHAMRLQNELICVLSPVDNRLECSANQIQEDLSEKPPRGYDYDVYALLDCIVYQFADSDGDEIPF